MKLPTITIRLIFSFVFNLIFFVTHAQLINGWRLSGSMIGYGVDVSEFAESTSSITPDNRDSGLGFQLDIGFRTNDRLVQGIIYTRYSGDLSQGGGYAINSIQASVAYPIDIKNGKVKIVPQLAMGPQYFTKRSGGSRSYTFNDPFQMRYKIGAELKLHQNWYAAASFQYSNNLWGLVYNKTVRDTQRNITSTNFGVGVTYYIR